MKYLYPNISNTETIQLLKDKIRNEDPWSITRVGDGEIGILKGTLSEPILRRFCFNWGYDFDTTMSEGLREFQEIITNALVGSDVIGLMNPATKLVPYNPMVWSLSEERAMVMGIQDPMICDHQISRSKEMGNIFSFKEILQGKPLHIISPNVRELSPWISRVLGVDVTFTDHSGVNAKDRKKIIQSFNQIEAPVVVFGTGILKDYGAILAKQYGKVAIDFGATLDAWAGKKTRPWFTPYGPQGYLLVDEKFKK